MRRLMGVGLVAIGILGLTLGPIRGQGTPPSTTKPRVAPEINPTQAVSALALLSGGLLVIRRKKKQPTP
jgi:LPXTG-motif cell wall-anchored protein